MTIANAIKARQMDVGIGAGVESMSLFSMDSIVDINILSNDIFDNEGARNCLMNMGMTAENVAEQYKISRNEQDQMAVDSNKKAAAANKAGLLPKEITVYETIVKDKDGNEKKVVVDRDDGMREDTTLESLGKLKPAFKKGGSVTAGNSSQVTDGAAAVLLTRRDIAKKLGLKIQGRILGFAVAGCPPEIMGIGPAVAIPPALKKAGTGPAFCRTRTGPRCSTRARASCSLSSTAGSQPACSATVVAAAEEEEWGRGRPRAARPPRPPRPPRYSRWRTRRASGRTRPPLQGSLAGAAGAMAAAQRARPRPLRGCCSRSHRGSMRSHKVAMRLRCRLRSSL